MTKAARDAARMTYYAQTLVWPLLTALIAAACLFCLRGLIGRALNDRRERTRHPLRFVLTWIAVVGVWFACTALIYGIAERAGLKLSAADHWHDHPGARH